MVIFYNQQKGITPNGRSPGSGVWRKKMAYLQTVINEFVGGGKVDLHTEFPQINCDGLVVSDHKEIGDGEIDLWLCSDDDSRVIVRADAAGFTGVVLYGTRDDELTLAAWNADFDINILRDWAGDEAINSALEDAKQNMWG